MAISKTLLNQIDSAIIKIDELEVRESELADKADLILRFQSDDWGQVNANGRREFKQIKKRLETVQANVEAAREKIFAAIRKAGLGCDELGLTSEQADEVAGCKEAGRLFLLGDGSWC